MSDYHQAIKQQEKFRSQNIAALHVAVNKIIKHHKTKKKTVVDFPPVANYLSKCFPDVDISNMCVYITDPSFMSQHGFADIGGCYIPSMKLIMVKNKISLSGDNKTNNRFDDVLKDRTQCNVDVEDIVVHELLHAISDISGRSSRKFGHNEEEFVYTNCIDFYKQKGMSEQDIVNRNFLPFFIQDIMRDRQYLLSMVRNFSPNCGSTYVDIAREMRVHPNKSVDAILSKANEMGQHMIDLYNQYGRAFTLSAQIHDTNRFKFLDTD